jgi:hypothetical protein
MAKGLSGFYAITPVSAASGIFACKRLKKLPRLYILVSLFGPIFSKKREENY